MPKTGSSRVEEGRKLIRTGWGSERKSFRKRRRRMVGGNLRSTFADDAALVGDFGEFNLIHRYVSVGGADEEDYELEAYLSIDAVTDAGQ